MAVRLLVARAGVARIAGTRLTGVETATAAMDRAAPGEFRVTGGVFQAEGPSRRVHGEFERMFRGK